MSKSIAVFGGNGFAGRKICEVGLRRGWQVTAVSRSGKAPKAQSHSDHAWISKVQWELADLFDPASYRNLLTGKNAVVHSVGMLFEHSDYKSAINSNFNVLNDLLRFGRMLKGPNPMEKDYKGTFEAVQRDTAVLLADAFVEEAATAGISDPAFVYMSAELKPPFVPEGYLTTKREAEFELSCKEGLRALFMRPGMLYDARAPLADKRRLFGSFLSMGYSVKSGILGNAVPLLNEMVRPPLDTEVLAQKIFDKLDDPSASGPVPLSELAENQ